MILWEGNSQLDGAPIAAIATIGSRNPKTGDMVQVWIIRTDIAPHEAVKSGADRSVCGDCKHRHFKGGACYVQPFQAPLSVFRKYQRGGYESAAWIRKVTHALRTLPVRLGAYGDPVAVPWHVWEPLIAEGCGRWTGYTHQWRLSVARPYRQILMASVDSDSEARAARSLGWRYFLVLPSDASKVRDAGTVECLSEARGMSCAACGICDGTRADSRNAGAVSVVIGVHGARAPRFKLPVVR